MIEQVANLRNFAALKGINAAELSRQLGISPVSAKNLLTKDDVKPREATLRAIEDLLLGKPAKKKRAAKPKAEAAPAKPKRAAKPKAEEAPAEKPKRKVTRKASKPSTMDVEKVVMANLLQEAGLIDEANRRIAMVRGE